MLIRVVGQFEETDPLPVSASRAILQLLYPRGVEQAFMPAVLRLKKWGFSP